MKFIESLTFLQKSSYVSNLHLLKKKKKLILQSNQNSIDPGELESHDGSNINNVIDEDIHLTSEMGEASKHNSNPPLLNSYRTDSDVNPELKDAVKASSLKNIERFQTMPLRERSYYTKITRKPSENKIQIIDNIANKYATNLKSEKAILDYWDINVMLYMAAITVKNNLGDLKKTKQEKTTVTKPG